MLINLAHLHVLNIGYPRPLSSRHFLGNLYSKSRVRNIYLKSNAQIDIETLVHCTIISTMTVVACIQRKV